MADLPGDETIEVIIRDGTTSNNELAVNADGSIYIRSDGKLSTYSAGFSALVPAASPTDVFTITGSGSATIRVRYLQFSVSTTSGSGVGLNVTLVKRSTANSGGTSTTAANVPHDSASSAATATVRGYTANPTTGTLVGIVRSLRTEAVTSGSNRSTYLFDFSTRNDQALVLRGTDEVLSVNLGGTSVTGGIIGCSVEWTEE